jgi:predicted AAA+ superfamily ATPase
MTTSLTFTQQAVLDALEGSWPAGNVFVVAGDAGTGKTTVLREVQRRRGGSYLELKDLLAAHGTRHPLALEETFEAWALEALRGHDCVLVDDLHLLANVAEGCGTSYPRSGLLNVPLLNLAVCARDGGKKLVFGTDGHAPGPLHTHAFRFHLPDFAVADYEHLCRAYLGADRAGRLDWAKVHRFAPALNAHQLRFACLRLAGEAGLDTERFLDYLRAHHLASNVDLNEVQPVALRDLRGVDEVVESLEANIVVPLENDELAAEYGLKPKRGVLLVGPPGTGKTTVGRALAHRLRGKFFLIDGTFISGTHHFYGAVHRVFEEAKRNAPSVIFIDDSDVIFESGEELGLYRYLLTMLDGLESARAARVCVMLTAMDVSNLPPALIRSGRVELWLEMRLPDEAARGDILRQHLGPLPALAGLDVEALAGASEGCTGADLKRLVEDGKNLLAFDRARGQAPRPATEYFLAAAEDLRDNKRRYAEAEARARRQRPGRPVYYDVGDGARGDGNL